MNHLTGGAGHFSTQGKQLSPYVLVEKLARLVEDAPRAESAKQAAPPSRAGLARRIPLC